MKQRLISPDFIKGIAITLMVYGHITFVGEFSNIQKKIVDIIYTFHMPIFLIISGFFLNFIVNTKLQLVTLIKRIGTPYIIFISIYLISLMIVGKYGIKTTNPAPANFISLIKIIFLAPIGAYWFLHSLLIITVVSIIINSIIKNKNVLLFYIFTISIFLLLDLMELVSIRTSLYFILGHLLKELTLRKIKIPIFYIFILFPLSFIFYFEKDIKTFSIIEIVNCFTIFCILWSFSNYFEKSSFVKRISWIGQNTLIILLLHSMILVSLKPLKSIFLTIDYSGISYSLFITITTISLCLLASVIFDKLSISKYLFNTKFLYKPYKKE